MNRRYFIYVGNAYPHKNLERLMKAMTILNSESDEKFDLKIITGRSVFRKRLEKLVNSQNASDYVKLFDYLSDNELNNLCKDSIAFVFPTLDEGFGLPPMEAINAGTIAVVSKIPVLKEVYKNSVYYFNPLSISSISKVLLEMTKLTKSQKDTKVKSAQEYLKKYSWAKMAKETLTVYESVV